MHMKYSKTVIALMVALSTFAVTVLQAAPEAAPSKAQVAAAKQAFVDVPAAELGAKAAQMVASAPVEQKEAVAIAVVQAIAKQNAAALPSVVAAISKVAPKIATKVATAAAKAVPGHAIAISTAAASAVPLYAEQIFDSVAQVIPTAAAKKLTDSKPTLLRSIRSASNGDGPSVVNDPATGGTRSVPTAATAVEGGDPARGYAQP